MRAAGLVWAVVLAGGEGRRMAPLTRSLYGHALPKQFAALDGERTLLQQTMDRIAPLVPPQRTVVVVSQAHESLARRQLRGYPSVLVVAQPQDRGTAPGVLLPLSYVRASHRGAQVVVLPSDHYVRRPRVLLEAVVQALKAAESARSGIALVGATADRPATDLGWIVPEAAAPRSTPSAFAVARFVEKPPQSEANALLKEGGLWSTMIIAGRVERLWREFRRHLPKQTQQFERYSRRLGASRARELLESAYRRLAPADFSQSFLQAVRGLSVVPMRDAGWSDCGTPARLFECLEGTRALGILHARLRQAHIARDPRRQPSLWGDAAAVR